MSAGNGSIQVTCPQCQKQLGVPAQHAGKQGRCPACKAVFSIPSSPAPLAPAPQFAPQPQFTPQPQMAPQFPSQPNWQAPMPQPGFAPAPQWQAPAPAMPAAAPSPFGNVPASAAPWNTSPAHSPFPQSTPYSQPSPFGAPAAAQPTPMNGFQPLYPNQSVAAPAQAANPFAEQDGGDLRLAPADPLPASQSLTPAYSPFAPTASTPDPYSGSFGTEKRGMDAGILGGMGLMLLAVVWFFGGLAFDIIFFYPPILFIIGIVAVVRGLFNR